MDEETFNYRYLDGAACLNSYLINACFFPAWKEIVSEDNLEEVFYSLESRLNELSKTGGELKLAIPAVYFELEAI